MWSDEATFRLFPTSGKIYIRRGKGEEYKSGCVTQTVKYGGGKVSIWGCCHAEGVGPLARIDGNMDRHKYHAILVNTAIPFMRQLRRYDRKQRNEHKKDNEKAERVGWIFQQGQ